MNVERRGAVKDGCPIGRPAELDERPMCRGVRGSTELRARCETLRRFRASLSSSTEAPSHGRKERADSQGEQDRHARSLEGRRPVVAIGVHRELASEARSTGVTRKWTSRSGTYRRRTVAVPPRSKSSACRPPQCCQRGFHAERHDDATDCAAVGVETVGRRVIRAPRASVVGRRWQTDQRRARRPTRKGAGSRAAPPSARTGSRSCGKRLPPVSAAPAAIRRSSRVLSDRTAAVAFAEARGHPDTRRRARPRDRLRACRDWNRRRNGPAAVDASPLQHAGSRFGSSRAR